LIGLAPDVVVALGTQAVAGLQRVSRTVPIVFVQVTDPVGGGIVESLARPGGNTTGFAGLEYVTSGKYLELLKEIAPRVTRAAVTRDPGNSASTAQYAAIQSAASSLKVELRPFDVRDADGIERYGICSPTEWNSRRRIMPSVETAARSLKVEPIVAPVHANVEIETAIIALGREPGGGLVVIPDEFTNVHRASIISAAARNNVPAVYGQSTFARDGGLLSYGTDRVDNFRRAAPYEIAFYAARGRGSCPFSCRQNMRRS
jgi:putative ABC transport system substrate-binding protein